MQSAPASFRRRTLPDVEEVGEAAGGGGVVTGLLVGEQEALAVAVLGGGQAELGIEQDGRGVFGEDAGDEGLELLEVDGRRRRLRAPWRGTSGGILAGPWRLRR